MPALSDEIKARSLGELKSSYPALAQNPVLQEINDLAAADGDLLSGRSTVVMQFLINEIQKSDPQSAKNIYALMKEKEKEDEAQKKSVISSALLGYNSLLLNQRGTNATRERSEWMQDHDMARIMPSSHKHIEVLSAISTGTDELVVQTNSLIQETVLLQLVNDDIKYIMIPVGPGHWRGIYLTKPDPNQNDSKFKLEIFDSFGLHSANQITDFVLDFFSQIGIDAPELTLEYPRPPVSQADGYSCGDYVCAYSHQKMKDFGAPANAYNQDLIDALQAGNANYSLRKATLQVFDGGVKSNTTTNLPFVNHTLAFVLAGIALALVLLSVGALSMIGVAALSVLEFVSYALGYYGAKSDPGSNHVPVDTKIQHSHQIVGNSLGGTPKPAARDVADQSQVRSINPLNTGDVAPKAADVPENLSQNYPRTNPRA